MLRIRRVPKIPKPLVDPYVTNLFDKISAGKRVLNPQKGEKIFSQGDRADAIFFIQSGKVKMTVATNSRSLVLSIRRPTCFLPSTRERKDKV